MITTNSQSHGGKFTVKNLAVHIASVTPEQADKALGIFWWYGLIVVLIGLVGALYFA